MRATHIEVTDIEGRRHLLPVSMVEVREAPADADCTCIVDGGSVRVYTNQPYEYFLKALLGVITY